MATLTKKRPAPPEEEYEMEEGPDDEDEIREGSAGRKRRSKRSMDGDCSCGKRKGKCDGSCGKTMKDGGMYKKPMMDRGDALTPQEYLAACDLGIQGQPRSYIRARLDYAERLDLKCGKGSISPGEKCTKGAAQKVAAVATLAGLAGNTIASGYAGGKAFAGDFKGAARGLQFAGASQAVAGLGARGMGLKKEGNRMLAEGALTAAGGTLIREGQTGEIGRAIRQAKNSQLGKRLRYAPSNAVGRVRVAAIRNRPMPKPKMKNGKVANPWFDSIYADGFSFDPGQLVI